MTDISWHEHGLLLLSSIKFPTTLECYIWGNFLYLMVIRSPGGCWTATRCRTLPAARSFQGGSGLKIVACLISGTKGLLKPPSEMITQFVLEHVLPYNLKENLLEEE